jgi:hypothetical protein
MLVELSDRARLECASLVYREWCKAFDGWKDAKEATWESRGRFCPKGDWPEFYKSALGDAKANLDKWVALKEEVCKYSPLLDK